MYVDYAQEVERRKLFLMANPSQFHGDMDPIVVSNWIMEMENAFVICGCFDHLKVFYASFMLRGQALYWWNMIKESRETEKIQDISFGNIDAATEEKIIRLFIRGLKSQIKDRLDMSNLKKFEEVIQQAMTVEKALAGEVLVMLRSDLGLVTKIGFKNTTPIPYASAFPTVDLFRNLSRKCVRVTNTQTPPPATTVVNKTGAPVTNTVANHAERPEKFNGQSSNAQAVQAVEAWKHSDFLCHNYVLNGLIDPLYNVYCKTTTAKELWESLERKYKTEDASTKKFVVARFLDYKMVDSKNVISQVQGLQVLIHDIHAEGMTLSETFQAAAITEKLPPSWVEFKNYLKHKRKEMSVEDLVVRLRIEKDNMLAQKDTYTPDSAKANMIEHAGSSSRSNPREKGKDKRKNDKKSKGKSEYLAPKARIMKQKFQETCYNCNSATADIKDEGDVVLKMTSEKELKLTNVLGYAMNDMFKLNVMVVKNEINKINSFAYLIESSNVWHGRLGHTCDKGGEYASPFAELCAKHRIIHEFTTPYSPQQNGIAKRKNRTLKEIVTAMLISSSMSQDMWGEAIMTATYLLNKIPRKDKEETLLNYGWEENHHISTYEYAKNISAYRFIVHDSKNPDIQKNTVMESKNASLFENIFPCLTKGTGSSLDDEVVQDKRQRDENDLQVERQD
nr:uncharacterized protein [Tanacetum cinerariifolium]